MKTIFSIGMSFLLMIQSGVAQNEIVKEWESLADSEDGTLHLMNKCEKGECHYAILVESGNKSKQVAMRLPSGVGRLYDFELSQFSIGPKPRPGVLIIWRNELYHSYGGERGGGFGFDEGWIGIWELDSGSNLFSLMPYYSMNSEEVFFFNDTTWVPKESAPDSLVMVVETRDSSVYDECYWDFDVRVEKDGRILVQQIEDENTVLMPSRNGDGCVPDVKTGVYVFFDGKFVYKTPD